MSIFFDERSEFFETTASESTRTNKSINLKLNQGELVALSASASVNSNAVDLFKFDLNPGELCTLRPKIIKHRSLRRFIFYFLFFYPPPFFCFCLSFFFFCFVPRFIAGISFDKMKIHFWIEQKSWNNGRLLKKKKFWGEDKKDKNFKSNVNENVRESKFSKRSKPMSTLSLYRDIISLRANFE